MGFYACICDRTEDEEISGREEGGLGSDSNAGPQRYAIRCLKHLSHGQFMNWYRCLSWAKEKHARLSL